MAPEKVPTWLDLDAIGMDTDAIASLIAEGRAMMATVEDYARRVFVARCPSRIDKLPDDVFELVETLSGSEMLFDVVDDLVLTLKAAIEHAAEKVIAERPHWAPEGYEPS
jgi:hypothetical protein